MEKLDFINKFLDNGWGVTVALPGMENEKVLILKAGASHSIQEAYKQYFTILKFNVLELYWPETPANMLAYRNLLDAALRGDLAIFLTILGEMEKKP